MIQYPYYLGLMLGFSIIVWLPGVNKDIALSNKKKLSKRIGFSVKKTLLTISCLATAYLIIFNEGFIIQLLTGALLSYSVLLYINMIWKVLLIKFIPISIRPLILITVIITCIACYYWLPLN